MALARRGNILCGICFEEKCSSKTLKGKACSHIYCHDCIAQYVLYKMEDKLVPINCPEPSCSQNLTPEQCGNILPREALDKWHLASVEAAVPNSHRYYRPFSDFSTLIFTRMFSAQCLVSSHDFQRLDPSKIERDDLELLALVKETNWQRCRKCRSFVERVSGCSKIIC
ncbi:hypothetical protein KI387_030447, partial [Taxus chinensis]